MKRFLILLAISAVLMTACDNKEHSFMSEAVKHLKIKQSIHYKINQKYYYLNAKDTAYTPCEVWIVRNNADSLRKGTVWANNYYRPYHMFLENGDFYLSIPPKKVTAFYPKFKGGLISNVDAIDFFLTPELFEKQLSDSNNLVSITDTIFQNNDCKKIFIQSSKSKKSTQSATYIISKNHYMPLYAVLKTRTKEYTLFEELTFSDFTFNQVNAKGLHKKQERILSENPVEDREASSETSKLESMLHMGDKAPLFKGKFYSDKADFTLKDYIGKHIIIVDFWYTHCPPCVRAIPSLMSLYEEHKDKGLKIFGLNSVDNQARSLKNLDKFLSKRTINYDIVMIESEVDMNYKIKQYPTLYIIDKNGDIAFVELGYTEESFEHLKAKVEALLK